MGVHVHVPNRNSQFSKSLLLVQQPLLFPFCSAFSSISKPTSFVVHFAGKFSQVHPLGLFRVSRGVAETKSSAFYNTSGPATYSLSRTMLGRNVCLAALIAVAVQVTAVDSAASSICRKAEECYVNGSSSKVCDRTTKKCNRCVSEKDSDSWLESLGAWTEYNCYAYDDDGECPKGTTECPATLTTSSDEESSSQTQASSSDESSKSTSSSTKKKSSSASSDSSKSTNSSTSTKKKKSAPSSSSTSSSSSTTKKPSTKKTTKPTLKSSYSSSSDTSAGDSSSASTSDSFSESASTSSSASAESNSALQSSAGSSGSEDDVLAKTSSVQQPTDAPTTNTQTETKSTSDKTLSDNKSSNTASGDSGSGGNKLGLIAGIAGGACVLVAIAGFVFWKKKQDDEDSDDEEAAFSPNKPQTNRNMAALPSASSATTAYTAQSNFNDYDNNYGNNYGNNYNNNAYDNKYSNYASNYDDGYNNNYTATQYAAGAGAVPVSYGSPSSIDIDEEDKVRRTDSILGGTGITTSSEQTPFDFSGGPSPANTDVWGNEVGSSFRQKRTASNVSVEF
ncbi:hypothetical protein PHMEG_00026524, partial [Phytophthora megakarya]